MIPALINNFCDGSPVEVDAYIHKTCGPLVTVLQHAGSLSFQHSMRPEQACEMAAALIACAGDMEAVATRAAEVAA